MFTVIVHSVHGDDSIKTQDIRYDSDGLSMLGYLARPELIASEHRPAVLLSHEGAGMDDNVRERARRLARLGYVAFALDYFGEGRQPPLEIAQARLGELIDDPERTTILGTSGLNVLLDQPGVDTTRVAAIGFCFGGTMSLELARAGTPLRVIVGFHPGLPAPRLEDSKKITASVLMCCGSEDPVIPLSARIGFEEEMREAHVREWRIEVYGGVGHSFTNPAIDQRGYDGFAYNAAADAASWASMLELFSLRLDPIVAD